MVMSNPFMPRYEDLPDVISIFPLPGAVVMPGCDLHLNIFEPRYLNMIGDALSGHRLIGMIQPEVHESDADIGVQSVHKNGCAGRITSYQETNDGRILIVLTGVCRFRVAAEHETVNGYRQVHADWTPFREDMHPSDESVDVEALMTAVERYLGDNEMQANIESLNKLAPDVLVNTLTMHMPFSPNDKQALIDAETVSTRASLLIALCEFGNSSTNGDAGVRH